MLTIAAVKFPRKQSLKSKFLNIQPLKMLLAALLLTLGPAPRAAHGETSKNQLDRCLAGQPGRYVVMAEGSRGSTPIAQLIQEDWEANGNINGTAYTRIGKTFQELPYKGS